MRFSIHDLIDPSNFYRSLESACQGPEDTVDTLTFLTITRNKKGSLIMNYGSIAATYTINEAAEKLGIGRNAAYQAAKTGEIPTIRIGKRILVPAAPLRRMLGEEG